ncbi:MAG TPA: M56 family metallopeptidase, partial [Agriterribacter sp.]|nr:M56 family metallopeptidase [Agriterribacter sp.]
VNSRIIPFAFGKSIFMNRQLHDAKDMEDIIKHEFVHIRQKHSIDIIWAELLCVLNWYNPFVWWIRSSIKQNLEYLADKTVLQDGMDKKQYQYLLLKVLGDHRFAIAQPFNFSSLKKRIAMMNKMQNTSIHLLKFLFMLPLIAVMVMAFREDHSPSVNKTILLLSGITFDKITELPVSGVTVSDSISGTKSVSDRNGFYTLAIPATGSLPFRIHVNYEKEGYPLTVPLISTMNSISDNMIIIEGLVNERDKNRGIKPSLHAFSSSQPGSDSYSYALEKFESYIFQKRIGALVQNSTKPVWIIDGTPYAFMKDGVAWFDKEEVTASPECRVWFDGKIMSIGEANNTVNRFELNSIGAMPKQQAQKILGINCNVLMLAKDSTIPRE